MEFLGFSWNFEISFVYFENFSTFGKLRNANDAKINQKYADAEYHHCGDLLKQTEYTLQRAQKADMEERRLREKQEAEREALRQKQIHEEQQRYFEFCFFVFPD